MKHAIYHLTDAGKQADNIARVLCSLRYVQQKLKLMREIPGGVAVRYLLDDYEHSHYQVSIANADAAGYGDKRSDDPTMCVIYDCEITKNRVKLLMSMRPCSHLRYLVESFFEAFCLSDNMPLIAQVVSPGALHLSHILAEK